MAGSHCARFASTERRSRLRLPLLPPLVAMVLASAGCNSILGIEDHPVGPSKGDGGAQTGLLSDSGSPLDTEASGEGGPKGNEASQDGGTDKPPDSGTDGPVAYSGGGAVGASSCGGDAGACVSGGIVSVGRALGDSGVGILPSGSVATVTDDGFEFGATNCDPTGTTCVIGGITP
jgi:hypothetical protein